MTPDREEVLRMAREANLLQAVDAKDGYIRDGIYLNELKAFYAIAYEAGARAERDECAKVADAAAAEATRVGRMHPEDSDSRDRLFARAREAGYIAAEIRARTT